MNLKLDGRRLLVDFERGRSILNFKPMRLGKGLGGKSRVSISRSSSSSTVHFSSSSRSISSVSSKAGNK